MREALTRERGRAMRVCPRKRCNRKEAATYCNNTRTEIADQMAVLLALHAAATRLLIAAFVLSFGWLVRWDYVLGPSTHSTLVGVTRAEIDARKSNKEPSK